MKYRWDKKYLYWGMTILFVVITSLCFYYLLFHGNSVKEFFQKIIIILMPIINGFALAYLLTPIVNVIEKKILKPIYINRKIDHLKKADKSMRVCSILITLIIVYILTYSFASLIVPQIFQSIQSIFTEFDSYILNLTTWTSKILSDNPSIETATLNLLGSYSVEVSNWIDETLLPQINELIKTLSLGVIGFLKAIWNFLIGFILSIYILYSKELFAGQAKKLIYAIFETETANEFIHNIRFTHRTFSGFLGGKIIDSIIIGIICFIGTSMIGTPYPILISVVIGVTNIIPFFGPYLGAIPCSILILMINPIHCLYFIIFILFLQQFDGNVLGPKILGDSTGLSSFWVIFAITFFGGIFGIFGMFIGVPTFAVIYAAIKSLTNKMLKKKGLHEDTNKYLRVLQIKNSQYINIENNNQSVKEISFKK